MNNLTIIIPGKPIPNKRARFSPKTGKHYDPQKKEKLYLGCIIKQQINHQPKTIGCALYINFYMPIPKSFTKKQRYKIQEKILNHIKKPDIDNLEVLLLNSMTGIIYKDDSQVHTVYKRKMYDENPRIEIKIIWDE